MLEASPPPRPVAPDVRALLERMAMRSALVDGLRPASAKPASPPPSAPPAPPQPPARPVAAALDEPPPVSDPPLAADLVEVMEPAIADVNLLQAVAVAESAAEGVDAQADSESPDTPEPGLAAAFEDDALAAAFMVEAPNAAEIDRTQVEAPAEHDDLLAALDLLGQEEPQAPEPMAAEVAAEPESPAASAAPKRKRERRSAPAAAHREPSTGAAGHDEEAALPVGDEDDPSPPPLETADDSVVASQPAALDPGESAREQTDELPAHPGIQLLEEDITEVELDEPVASDDEGEASSAAPFELVSGQPANGRPSAAEWAHQESEALRVDDQPADQETDTAYLPVTANIKLEALNGGQRGAKFLGKSTLVWTGGLHCTIDKFDLLLGTPVRMSLIAPRFADQVDIEDGVVSGVAPADGKVAVQVAFADAHTELTEFVEKYFGKESGAFSLFSRFRR